MTDPLAFLQKQQTQQQSNNAIMTAPSAQQVMQQQNPFATNLQQSGIPEVPIQ